MGQQEGTSFQSYGGVGGRGAVRTVYTEMEIKAVAISDKDASVMGQDRITNSVSSRAACRK